MCVCGLTGADGGVVEEGDVAVLVLGGGLRGGRRGGRGGRAGRRVRAAARVARVAVAGARPAAARRLLVRVREVVRQPRPRLVLSATHWYTEKPPSTHYTLRTYKTTQHNT